MCACVCVCVCVFIYPYIYIHAALVACVFVCVWRESEAHARESVSLDGGKDEVNASNLSPHAGQQGVGSRV
jgi:hypothetical protein